MSCHCRECGFGKKLNRTSFVVTKNDLEKIVKQSQKLYANEYKDI